MSTIHILMVLAWCMGLVISSPMYIDYPGFSNFYHIMNETTIMDNSKGGCMPPVISKISACNVFQIKIDFLFIRLTQILLGLCSTQVS